MLYSRRLALQYFFAAFFPLQQGYVEIRPFHPDGTLARDKRAFLPVADKARLARYVLSLKNHYHVYFGVCTRTEEAKRVQRGTAQYLDALTAFWADLDSKRFGGLTAAKEALNRFRFPPSILVFTGHGYHAYWLLDQPFTIEGSEAAILQLGLKALQTVVLGSDDVSDFARIMRVPWSYNLKDERHPILTKVISLNETRYRSDTLVAHVPWGDMLHGDSGKGNGLFPERYAGLDRVMEGDFITHCREHAKTLSEPLWYAMITNLIIFRSGRKAIHTLSQPHPNYSFDQTEEKIAHALNAAPSPHSYLYIAEHGFRSNNLANSKLVSPASRAFANNAREGKSLT